MARPPRDLPCSASPGRREFLSRTLQGAAGLAALKHALPARAEGGLRVVTSFPGGSAKVESLDEVTRTVRLSPTPHPERGWDCWWYFKLEGLRAGDAVTVNVGGHAFARGDRAMVSVDNRSWTHSAPGRREGDRILYTLQATGPELWVCWGPPFTLEAARELVERSAAAARFARPFELCRSREGRAVPALRVTEAGLNDPAPLGIWIQARQHAWESGSSWVCRGLTEWLISDDPRASALRKKALVTIVPIMDVDNVERGAGGKDQKPQDHNRDWSAAPHWPEVRAAQQEIARLNAAGTFDMFVDLHNPAPNDREPEFFLTPRDLLSERGRQNQAGFLAAARTEMTGPLAYRGKVRETGAGYDKNWERISKIWVTRNTRDHVVTATLETAWNTPQSTAENYRQIGRELGLAIERYFQQAPRR